jgi:hypothetical protein
LSGKVRSRRDVDSSPKVFKRNLPNEYRDREATLDAWVALGFEPATVARVLGLLSTAFRWSKADGLRLRPDDQVWALYYSYYPRLTGWRRWVGSIRPDELEMETVLRDLKKAALPGRTVDLHPAVTVGELVKQLEQ